MNNSDSFSGDSAPPATDAVGQAFETVIGTLNERQIRYALIGGLALLQHARTRTTEDVDIMLTAPQIALPGLFEALQARGCTIDLYKNLRELRDDGYTAIAFRGVIIDLMTPLVEAYRHVLDRAQPVRISNFDVRVATAEGLIVMKLMAMRPQDQADIRDLLLAQFGRLDLDYIRAEIDTFAPDDDPRRATFEDWVREFGETTRQSDAS